MKHIIGIDAGTNSIGWSLCKEHDDNHIELIDIGAYIFPIGTNVDDKSNKETTKNETRRIYRGMRRNLYRYKLRREKLKSILNKLGMLDSTKTSRKKEKYQSFELYQLRAKALDRCIPLDEIGRIFLLLNKYRGFKSNSKKIFNEEDLSNEQKEENKEVAKEINDLRKYIVDAGARTIGEYFYLMHREAKELYNKDKWHNPNEPVDERAINEKGEIILHNSRGIRRQFGRYTSREMYQKEFDLIWDTQKKYYDKTQPNIFTGSAKEYEEIKKLNCDEKSKKLREFKKTNYWLIRNYCIYYQRPLKSQRKFVANCQFEKSKKVIPASSPLYQEFRVWKNLSDLRYSCEDEDIVKQPLPLEWKRVIADYLETNEKVYISKPIKGKLKSDKKYIIDILPDLSNSVSFKTIDEDGEKYIKGNLTYYAINQALGKKEYERLKSEKLLEKLWHHLYMAKDDEWLKDILMCKWKFEEVNVNRLIEFGLEEGHGAYSAKLIKKILPFMKGTDKNHPNGTDEYTALILAGYLKSSDEIKDELILKEKISQISYQELRNPVVEKSVSQVIKIVNAILEKYKYEIDREKLEIRIESTRELKKPRHEREKLLRTFREKDKVRQEYAKFLNKKREEGKLKFSRKVEKYDSIIGKYELWLEMGMDKDDQSFVEFNNIANKYDKEKHRLWLECNRICPYTGKTISLTKLFSSEIEIEHIIPLSRSLDDSFNNKTITFSWVNHEKGNRTAYEYMQWKNDIAGFKKRVKDTTNNFSKSKKEQFLNPQIEGFSHDQLSNTSYIAKYVRRKMMEVCRKVQFTNGRATADLRKNDWKVSDLLDKIRFEEESGIDNIDVILDEYRRLRRDFINWYRIKEKSTDIKVNVMNTDTKLIKEYEKETGNSFASCMEMVKSFNQFKNKSGGGKDRTDHRHHAIDAFITACCSPSITKKLSTFNRYREENKEPLYDEYGRLTRKLIEQPFDYAELKQKIKEILVCHKVNQKLIVSKLNRYKTGNGIMVQRTYAPQGALHKDGLYGKLKKPYLQGFNKENVFVKRTPIYDPQQKKVVDISKVVDKKLREEILPTRIEKYGTPEKAFSKDALENDPLFMYSAKQFPNGNNKSKKGKQLPVIKNVRVINKNARNLIQLPAKDVNRKVIYDNRYAEAESNYIMALYELKEKNKDGKTKIIRDFRLLSFFEAVKRKRNGERLFDDVIEKNNKYIPLMQDCNWLKQGDLVILYENEEDKISINWNNKLELSKRLFKVRELGFNSTGKGYAVIKLEKHNLQKTSNQKYSKEGYFVKKSETINAIKVRISPLGEILLKGKECF